MIVPYDKNTERLFGNIFTTKLEKPKMPFQGKINDLQLDLSFARQEIDALKTELLIRDQYIKYIHTKLEWILQDTETVDDTVECIRRQAITRLRIIDLIKNIEEQKK